ncbi:MAG TPA: sigma-70 family RNA polymerase sigma factor [Gemmataceae bacterium]|jgi:RNA polymerase sigma factor (sigma-70 family)|nr:sigma-70 family RNA polymerase sigma factor [Gemmataceae bacterium]
MEIRDMRMTEPDVASTAGADDLTDEVLLERFTSRREEAAFASLVRRHGPLVLAVCRRALHHEQDAEDAFQAVFSVLARRAGSIRKRGAVGAWLHAVAYRIARKVRADRGRQPVPATNLADVPAAEDSPEWAWRELRPILDEEVNRLPDKYRQAFVLCHLEGRTNEQAAAHLGCPLGTVLSRLARARERLRAQLTRRGLGMSAGALAAALGGEAAGAVVPPLLIQAAAAFARGRTAASSSVSALTEGFLQSQSRARLMRVAAGLLAVTLAGVVLLLLFLRRPGAEPAPPPRTDRQPLQGTWRVSRAEADGRVLPPPDMRLIFAGDQCTLTSNIGMNFAAQCQLDSNRTPREITLRLAQGVAYPGIYRLEGDSLKLCLNHGGPKRPTEFTTQAGDGFILYVLEREPAAPP